jgi:hypothetical protein
VVALLEVRLREGDGRMWAVKCGRVEIEIWEGAIRIKGILNGTLDIEEPLTEVTLCETVVWKGLFKLEEGLLSKLWARGNGGTSPLSFISLLSTSFLSLGSKHESKQTVESRAEMRFSPWENLRHSSPDILRIYLLSGPMRGARFANSSFCELEKYNFTCITQRNQSIVPRYSGFHSYT